MGKKTRLVSKKICVQQFAWKSVRISNFFKYFKQSQNFSELYHLVIGLLKNETQIKLVVIKRYCLLFQCTRCVMQVSFQWIYHCHSSKSIAKETGKTHLCAMYDFLELFKRVLFEGGYYWRKCGNYYWN